MNLKSAGIDIMQLYFEHADQYGPLLNIKVAQKRTTAGRVSMVKVGSYTHEACYLIVF